MPNAPDGNNPEGELRAPRAPRSLIFGAAAIALGIGAFLAARHAPERIVPPPPDAQAPLKEAGVAMTADSVLKNILDAGPPRAFIPDRTDAGPSVCRLAFGPEPQLLSGPATLRVNGSHLDIIAHQKGVPKIRSVSIEPLRSARSSGPSAFSGTPDKASRPACSAQAASVFCSDNDGVIHRYAADGSRGREVAHAEPGARIAAAVFPGTHHTALGFLATKETPSGKVMEAWVMVDDDPPVRISEDGNGGTDLLFYPHKDSLVAVVVDARRAMTPVHARTLTLDPRGRLKPGDDAVVFVGGGADTQVYAGVASDPQGDAYVLLPHAGEKGFGLSVVELSHPPAIDESSTFSVYPNGFNTAPIAGTTSTKRMFVARVLPESKDPNATRILEIGEIKKGEFSSLGNVSSSGTVTFVTLAVDSEGGLWVYYTDGAGSFLERRACP